MAYDFSGWATRNNLKCADGRTIMKDAFKSNDGQTVPLVWNHQHNSPDNVLGHALLENREDGVYAYGTFNETEAGQAAKLLVQHGDVSALSIYANGLKQRSGNVLHGAIREVSLVLAGANPGAFIDSVLSHGEESEEEAVIYTDEEIELYHADDDSGADGETMQDIFDTLTEKQKNVVYAMLAQAAGGELSHSDNGGEGGSDSGEGSDDGETVGDVLDTLNDEQTALVNAMLTEASGGDGSFDGDPDEVFNSMTEKQQTAVYACLEDTLKGDDNDSNNEEEEEETMKHNIFDNEDPQTTLQHSAEDLAAVIGDGKRYGSLKESALQHGIDDIDYLFPDYKELNNPPAFISLQPNAWITTVMNGVHHSPFSRVRMTFADITMDEARARGYIKGNLKVEETFGLLRRTVDPTTVYKKQKFDRDDVVDITDFDVISWVKTEMRGKLDEEIARAIVFGDGRSTTSDDKIDETKIIPIVSDAELYTISYETSSDPVDMIDAAVKAQDNYQGSGNLKMFVPNSTVSSMLLVKDLNQRRIYKDINELATACAVDSIVKVPDSIVPEGVLAVIVDLSDYNVGADKGGAVNMFDDFDIDYNQMKYLIETRCSGSLIKPYSAIVLKEGSSDSEEEAA